MAWWIGDDGLEAGLEVEDDRDGGGDGVGRIEGGRGNERIWNERSEFLRAIVGNGARTRDDWSQAAGTSNMVYSETSMKDKLKGG